MSGHKNGTKTADYNPRVVYYIFQRSKSMAKRLFVGSLPYSADSAQLETLFSQAGKVESVNVITDRYSGRSKGFAFVEMGTEDEAKNAIKTLNGYSMDGRNIVVSEARPQENRESGGGSAGGGWRSDNRGGSRPPRSAGHGGRDRRGFSRPRY